MPCLGLAREIGCCQAIKTGPQILGAGIQQRDDRPCQGLGSTAFSLSHSLGNLCEQIEGIGVQALQSRIRIARLAVKKGRFWW